MSAPWQARFVGLARRLGRPLIDLAFPPECPLCHAELPAEQAGDACESCRQELLASTTNRCPRCAARVSETLAPAVDCYACRGVSFRFDSAFALGDYDGLLRSAVLQMKHAVREPLSFTIGRMMAERFGEFSAQQHFDQIMPIPMHWRRRLTRATNSPDLVAEALGVTLKTPVDLRGLVRVRNTEQQTAVAASLRAENLRGAFSLRADRQVSGQAILVVDDILTTGATCSEAARVLKQAGAKSVHICVIARARSGKA